MYESLPQAPSPRFPNAWVQEATPFHSMNSFSEKQQHGQSYVVIGSQSPGQIGGTTAALEKSYQEDQVNLPSESLRRLLIIHRSSNPVFESLSSALALQ